MLEYVVRTLRSIGFVSPSIEDLEKKAARVTITIQGLQEELREILAEFTEEEQNQELIYSLKVRILFLKLERTQVTTELCKKYDALFEKGGSTSPEDKEPHDPITFVVLPKAVAECRSQE